MGKKILLLVVILSIILFLPTIYTFYASTSINIKDIDKVITQNINNFSTEFSVNTTYSETELELKQVLESNTNKYYMDSYKIATIGSKSYVTIKWLIDRDEMSKVDIYVREVITSTKGNDIEDRLRCYIDAILLNARYETNTGDIDSHSPFCIVAKKEGVCQAYTTLFKKFLDYEGLENHIIEGTMNNAPHIWNKVKLDNSYYNIDVTQILNYRLNAKNSNLYFFLVSDRQLGDRTFKSSYESKSLKYLMLNKNYEMQQSDVGKTLKLKVNELTESKLSNSIGKPVIGFDIESTDNLYDYNSRRKDLFIVLVTLETKVQYYFLIDG